MATLRKRGPYQWQAQVREKGRPLARHYVAGIRGVDISCYRDERLRKVSSATVKRDLVLLGHVFEVECCAPHVN